MKYLNFLSLFKLPSMDASETGFTRGSRLPPIGGRADDLDALRSNFQTRLGFNNNPENEDLIMKGDAKPEIHFIGQILGGEGFDSGDGLFCEMLLQIGETWSLLSPKKLYQTQTCYADIDEIFVWSHPVDLHLAAGDLSGW